MYSITEQFIIWLGSQGYIARTHPPKTGDEFVTVERTGGNVQDMVDHPTVAVQVWAESEARAEEMAIAIRDALLTESLPSGVYRASVNAGPYPYWDEDTRLPRFQIVFEVTCQLTD